MDKSIIPECFADTLLIEMLVPTKTRYNHQHSCFKVEATMKTINKFAVGIIDRDKRQIKYLDEFQIIDEVKGKAALILWRHKKLEVNHFIVQICPALEQWLIEICVKESIDLCDFDENVLEGIKYHSKSSSRTDNPKLKKLFSEVIKRNESLSVKKLRNWITLLKEKNYKVDINELING